jgi:hypothetical protein
LIARDILRAQVAGFIVEMGNIVNADAALRRDEFFSVEHSKSGGSPQICRLGP